MTERKTFPLRKVDKPGIDIIPENLEADKYFGYLLCRLKTADGWEKYKIPLPKYFYEVFVEYWEKVERTEIKLARSPSEDGFEIIYPIVGKVKIAEGDLDG